MASIEVCADHAAETALAARGGPHGLHLIYSANPPNFGGPDLA